MTTPAPSWPQPTTRSRATWPAPRHLKYLAGLRAALLAFSLAVAPGVLAGCGREALISHFSVTPTPSVTASPPVQAARGLVGDTHPVTPTALTVTPAPSPTAAPTPTPLSGDGLAGLSQVTAAAADLIAAGSALQYAGGCAEAIPLYEQAISLDPSFSNVYTLLAFCRYNQGHVDEAIAHWQEALQRDPLSPDALAGLGTALFRQGQLEAGLARYGEAVTVDPGYRDEAYLHIDRRWDGPILLDSRVLRTGLVP